jgi:hypothetical protein
MSDEDPRSGRSGVRWTKHPRFRRAAEFVTIFATQLGRTGADEVIK